MSDEKPRMRLSAETDRWMRDMRQRVSIAERRKIAARIGEALRSGGATGGGVIDFAGRAGLRGVVLPVGRRVAVMTFYVADGIFVMLTVYEGTARLSPVRAEAARAAKAMERAQRDHDLVANLPMPAAGVGWKW